MYERDSSCCQYQRTELIIKIVVLAFLGILSIFLFVRPPVAHIYCEKKSEQLYLGESIAYKQLHNMSKGQVLNDAQLKALAAILSYRYQQCLHRWGE